MTPPSVVYRRSLPLAAEPPAVRSEPGPHPVVTGAAVLTADSGFEQAS
jgi:hypothetical protein